MNLKENIKLKITGEVYGAIGYMSELYNQSEKSISFQEFVNQEMPKYIEKALLWTSEEENEKKFNTND